MDPRPDILVANEPTMYRGVLASELSLLRPSVPIASVEPADLDTVVARIKPRLVICSELTTIVRQHASASIILYPNGTNRAVLDVDGQQQVLPNPDLSDLLVAVDADMERLWQEWREKSLTAHGDPGTIVLGHAPKRRAASDFMSPALFAPINRSSRSAEDYFMRKVSPAAFSARVALLKHRVHIQLRIGTASSIDRH